MPRAMKFVDDHPWPEDIQAFLDNNEFGQKVKKCLLDDFESMMEDGYEDAYQMVREKNAKIAELETEVSNLRQEHVFLLTHRVNGEVKEMTAYRNDLDAQRRLQEIVGGQSASASKETVTVQFVWLK